MQGRSWRRLWARLGLGRRRPHSATVAGAKAQEAQQAKQQVDAMQAQIQSATDKAQAQQKALPD